MLTLLQTFIGFVKFGHPGPMDLNISLGIWSGQNIVIQRVGHLSKTWLKFWKDAYVFAEEWDNQTCDILNRMAKPCHIHCIPTGIGESEVLFGTSSDKIWNKAQFRFLPAMKLLYDYEPNSEFYFFVDDDSYAYINPLIDFMSTLNPDSKHLYGHYWSTALIYTNTSFKTSFTQGGCGVLLPHKAMAGIAPYLNDCSKSINSPQYPANVRFAMCMRENFAKEWDFGDFRQPRNDYFNQLSPTLMNYDAKLGNASTSNYVHPIVHHRIFKDSFPENEWCHFFEFDFKGHHYYADLSSFSVSSQLVQLGCFGCYHEYHFGSSFSPIDTRKMYSRAIGPIVASIDEDGNLISINQKYQHGIEVTLKCTNKISNNQMIFSHFEGQYGNKLFGYIPCDNITIVEIP